MLNTPYKIKNNTSTVKKWGGVRIPPGGEYLVEVTDLSRLIADSDFLNDIDNDNAIVSDNNITLTPEFAKNRLNYNFSLNVFFESENTDPVRNNGFQSINAQEAIEEAKATALGKVRANRTFSHNGTMGGGFWHGYSELINSYSSPMIIPWNCLWKDYTFVTDRNSVGGRLDFYLNGTSDSNIFYSIDFNNVNQILIATPNISLDQGDLLRARWVDLGQNPRDVISTFDFQLT